MSANSKILDAAPISEREDKALVALQAAEATLSMALATLARTPGVLHVEDRTVETLALVRAALARYR